MRTEQQVFMDFNPSDQFHWIYDEVLTKKDCKLIKSTYRDNPYLSKTVVKQIEEYKKADQNYWRIYGLGERGISQTTIYTHYELVDEFPKCDDIVYGLDFGYNNPSGLVKVGIKDNNIYWQELLYESHLTNAQLIDKVKDLVEADKYIYCDSSEPDRIEEMIQAGLNAKKAYKEVLDGIDIVKARQLYITKDSVNMLKEIKSYQWKEKDEKPIDEPVKANDHLMDASRYGTASYFKEPEVVLDIV